ncbi:GNAT family N-acetyltransferase [Klebsiella indica]|uniref:GNAT family N-acetyltransferase n=1 Tax=Klebsiella indica TaxID=2582917 RepID=A0A5R9LDJ8_9ENTR|nr:GNAT family N-acetyltransferase [Klebsiella indica]TLV11654.1 GNAT family N-acetyltransferase [Klebsiella indica]
MNMILTASPHPDDVNHIRQQLTAFNQTHVDLDAIKTLAVFIHDERGHKTARLLAITWGNWMQIQFLWVNESLRGTGLGARMLQAAEAEARSRGCHSALVDTFSFQARGFYERQGYLLQMTLEQMPYHHRQHYLVKALIPE